MRARPGEGDDRVRRIERAGQGVDVETAEHGAGATHVVEIGMAEDQQVDMGIAARAQQRHQYALAGVAVACVLRPGVEQQDVATRADQHGHALPHVGGDRGRTVPGAGSVRGGTSSADGQRQAEPAQAPRDRHDDEGGRERAPRAAPSAAPPARPRRRPGIAARLDRARRRAPAPPRLPSHHSGGDRRCPASPAA